MKKERMAVPAIGGSSLLVIFAVLCLTVFALLSVSTVNAHQRLAQNSRESVAGYYRADAQAERADALQRQLWTENIVLDNSLLLTVSVDRSGNIRLETEGNGLAALAYDWADDTYARNKLRGLLLEQLRDTDREAVFLVFQYDRARVYHAEYQMIETIIQEIKQEARTRDIPLSVLEMDLFEA